MQLVLWLIFFEFIVGLFVFASAADRVIDRLTRIADALEGREPPLSTTEMEREFREKLGRGGSR